MTQSTKGSGVTARAAAMAGSGTILLFVTASVPFLRYEWHREASHAALIRVVAASVIVTFGIFFTGMRVFLAHRD